MVDRNTYSGYVARFDKVSDLGAAAGVETRPNYVGGKDETEQEGTTGCRIFVETFVSGLKTIFNRIKRKRPTPTTELKFNGNNAPALFGLKVDRNGASDTRRSSLSDGGLMRSTV